MDGAILAVPVCGRDPPQPLLTRTVYWLRSVKVYNSANIVFGLTPLFDQCATSVKYIIFGLHQGEDCFTNCFGGTFAYPVPQ